MGNSHPGLIQECEGKGMVKTFPVQEQKEANKSDGGMDSGLWSSLPEEVVDRILAFLPLPSFFRLQVVCKRWNSLRFCRGFLDVYSEVTTRRPWLLIFAKGKERPDVVHLSNLQKLGLAYNYLLKRLSFAYNAESRTWYNLALPCLPPQASILAASGGLLCCEGGTGYFLVCNPVTNTWRPLPPSLLDRNTIQFQMVVEHSTRAYKVIAVGGSFLYPPGKAPSDGMTLGTNISDYRVRLVLNRLRASSLGGNCSGFSNFDFQPRSSYPGFATAHDVPSCHQLASTSLLPDIATASLEASNANRAARSCEFHAGFGFNQLQILRLALTSSSSTGGTPSDANLVKASSRNGSAGHGCVEYELSRVGGGGMLCSELPSSPSPSGKPRPLVPLPHCSSSTSVDSTDSSGLTGLQAGNDDGILAVDPGKAVLSEPRAIGGPSRILSSCHQNFVSSEDGQPAANSTVWRLGTADDPPGLASILERTRLGLSRGSGYGFGQACGSVRNGLLHVTQAAQSRYADYRVGIMLNRIRSNSVAATNMRSATSDYYGFTVEVYDSKVGRWERVGLLPREVDSISRTSFCSGFLYCLAFNLFRIFRFHMAAGTWNTIDIPAPFFFMVPDLVELSGRLLLVGGVKEHSLAHSIIIWELEQTKMEWSEVLKMPDELCREFHRGEYFEVFRCEGHGSLMFFMGENFPRILVYDFDKKSWHWSPTCHGIENRYHRGFKGFCFQPRLDALV